MAERKIQIEIAATGGDQAAAEIRKPADAEKELQHNSKGSSDAVESLGVKSNVAGASMIGLAAGGRILGEIFGEIRKGIEGIDIEKLREVNPALAGDLEGLQKWSELFSDPLHSIMRFVSGNTIGEAFADVNAQLEAAAQGQHDAVMKIIENGRMTADEMKNLAKEIADSQKVISAKDAADAKKRDAEDAARIRGGASKEGVAADRAAYDRDQAIAAVNRDVEGKARMANTRYADMQSANYALEAVKRNENATPEDVEKASKAADDAKKAYDEAVREWKTADAIAAEARRGIGYEYERKVADEGKNKADRIAKERAEIEEEGKRAMEKALRDQERKKREEESRGRRDEDFTIRREGEEAKIGQDAVKLLPEGVRDSFRRAVEKAARGLQDGDQGGELQELISLMNMLAGAVKGKDAKTSGELAALRREIAILQNQIKNNRR